MRGTRRLQKSLFASITHYEKYIFYLLNLVCDSLFLKKIPLKNDLFLLLWLNLKISSYLLFQLQSRLGDDPESQA